MSRVFSKVLICSRETEALKFDGEIPLSVKDFQQILGNPLETVCLIFFRPAANLEK